MNKIILNFGLLVFFISVIIFSQRGLFITDVLLKSFIIFFAVTLMAGLLMLVFIKAINKTSMNKEKEINENILGSEENE